MPRNVRPEKSSHPSVTLPVPHASRRYEPARRLDFDPAKGERDAQERPSRKFFVPLRNLAGPPCV